MGLGGATVVTIYKRMGRMHQKWEFIGLRMMGGVDWGIIRRLRQGP
jgi:hypothetical protein